MVPFFVYGKIQMNISIIIPAYNEAENIVKLVSYLQQNAPLAEIIVVDGGSTDDTLNITRNTGVCAVLSPQKGRAAQMNYGASLAKGDVLYFVHADVFPPATFVTDIQKAITEGYDFGRYIMRFKTKKWYLRINEWFTRFDWFVCYGGDQTLFVKRNLFESSGAFRNDMRIMEDFEFTKRIKDTGAKYKIFKKGALISDRKYDNNSWWRVQKANYTIVKMYKQGASQDAMIAAYKKMLDYR
jgi:rSAM/selenodomain-associated transferase 2